MKINLTGGNTPSRSVIASSQRTLNLYAEATDKTTEEPAPVTHYPTPGLTLLGTTPNGKSIRGLYRASNGDLYCAAGFDVYYISPTWVFNLVGTMNIAALNPVKFTDNGTSVCLCDGTLVNGYSINMSTRSGLTPLLNPTAGDLLTASSTGWLGSTFLDFTDTYIIANYPGTPTYYISNSEDVIFDPLQFNAKSANPDFLVAAIVQHRVIWLIGTVTTEVHYNTGGGGGITLSSGGTTTPNSNTFPFELMPGVAIDWGCVAPYSIAKAETAVFWLAQNQNGQVVALRGFGYTISRISTHAVEFEWSQYPTVADCIAYAYMQNGHSFWVMNFPTADKTWVFDLAMAQWHERCYLDMSGNEHRQRADCHAHAYNTHVVNDWETGNLYNLDLNAYTDNGQGIKRLIGFPRQIDAENDRRILFKSFIAEMDTGETLIPGTPLVTLRWSDDKGHTWNAGRLQSMGKTGQFNTVMKYMRLGMSRNRVFQLEWTANSFCALQAAFLDVTTAGS